MSTFGIIIAVILIGVLGYIIYRNVKGIVLNIKHRKEEKKNKQNNNVQSSGGIEDGNEDNKEK